MGYLEAGDGGNREEREGSGESTDGRPRSWWREGQKDRNTGVGSRDPGVLTSWREHMSQKGALPRPISAGSREKKELRSRREGRRGGLIRALAAAAPSAPLGEPPIPALATSKAPLLISSQRKGWRGEQPSQDWERDREDGDRDKQRGQTERDGEGEGGIKRLKERKVERRAGGMERWREKRQREEGRQGCEERE